jgi:HD superfamily phosphohydrolase
MRNRFTGWERASRCLLPLSHKKEMNTTPTSPFPFATRVPRKGPGFYYDTLYGHVSTGRALRGLIDLEIFQRLRGIRQLSTLYLIYPGANHTRFEHSIGVAFIARLFHERLTGLTLDPEAAFLEQVRLNEISLRAVEIAGLLHDIGHGPFGHVFEVYAQQHDPYAGATQDSLGERRLWTHEHWGEILITGKAEGQNAEISRLAKQIPEYLQKLRARLSRVYPNDPNLALLDPQNIANLCFGKPPDLGDLKLNHSFHFLKDIVPSVFGADRLDYLRRDARYTGVSTGNIDIWEIINSVELAQIDGKVEIRLNSGVSLALENLVRTRDIVYRALYFHRTHRGVQEMLVRAMGELKLPIHKLALMTDNDVLGALLESDNHFAKAAALRIRSRLLYEVIPILNHKDLSKYQLVIDKELTAPEDFGGLCAREIESSRSIGLPAHSRVMLDMQRIPAVRFNDLDCNIINERDGSGQTLLQISKPLKALFGGDMNENADSAVQRYNFTISNVNLVFPYDLISKEVHGIAEKLAGEQMFPAYDSLKASEMAQGIVVTKMLPLAIDYLSFVLGITTAATRSEFRRPLEIFQNSATASVGGIISTVVDDINNGSKYINLGNV